MYYHSNKFFSSDFVHPNENGEYAIALALSNYLKTGYFNTVEYMRDENCFENIVYENDISSTIKCIATVDCKNTILNLINGHIDCNLQDVELNGSKILIGVIKSAAINGVFGRIYFNFISTIQTDQQKFYNVPTSIIIDNNKIYVSMAKISDDETMFDTLTIKRISIYSTVSPIVVNSLIN